MTNAIVIKAARIQSYVGTLETGKDHFRRTTVVVGVLADNGIKGYAKIAAKGAPSERAVLIALSDAIRDSAELSARGYSLANLQRYVTIYSSLARLAVEVDATLVGAGYELYNVSREGFNTATAQATMLPTDERYAYVVTASAEAVADKRQTVRDEAAESAAELAALKAAVEPAPVAVESETTVADVTGAATTVASLIASLREAAGKLSDADRVALADTLMDLSNELHGIYA